MFLPSIAGCLDSRFCGTERIHPFFDDRFESFYDILRLELGSFLLRIFEIYLVIKLDSSMEIKTEFILGNRKWGIYTDSFPRKYIGSGEYSEKYNNRNTETKSFHR